jgi:hypothetical protein
MKNTIRLSLTVLLLTVAASAQKTNDAVRQRIRSLKADKTITLSYDKATDTSKIMVAADNFDGKEAAKAGIQAMNFGMATFYNGQAISTPPETFNFTFWVLTKKPVFGGDHSWVTSLAGGDTVNLGEARYVSKRGDNMEYLNFKISRADLAKIAASAEPKFKLGAFDFTFTPAHLTIFKNLLAVTDSH